MIVQGSETLYTLDELLTLLKDTNSIVLGIEKWYLNETINSYFEIPTYDFSN